MGDDLPILDIKKGDRVSEILQKLILQAFNPGCIDSDADCQSVLNFKSTLIAKTSIQLAWDAFDSATSYRVEYKLATASTWTLNPAVTTNTDTIGNLTADTEYHIRVATICGSDTCYSLTIAVKTSA
jgi:fructose 1,6-bisphosphatase